jgi:hypothetical protein
MPLDPTALLQLETLILLGLLLTVIGLLSRDEMVMRGLVLTGVFLDVVYFALLPTPLASVPATISVLCGLVLAGGYLVVRERSTLGLTAREKRLFEAYRTLTPGQFRKLNRLGRTYRTTAQTDIIIEARQPKDLFYIEGFRFNVAKSGQAAEARGPAFAGEIAFLTGNPASATVTLPPGTPYTAWSVAELERLMRRNAALRNALTARFSLDLAVKVAASMPMGRG